MREIRQCHAQSVMKSVTAFSEEPGDTGMFSWSHLQKLKADRGPADLRASLHCRGELLEALGRSIEMRTECVLHSGFAYPAGSSTAEFSPSVSTLLFPFRWPPQHHYCPCNLRNVL